VAVPTNRGWATDRRCIVVKPASGGPAVSRSLAAAGMKVTVATSEAEAIAALEREPPAVVLVAQALGPVAIASVAARAGHLQPEVPVVVLGAAGTVQEAVDAMQQGAADYLAPPFDAEPLLARLRRVLERGHAAEPQPSAVTSPFAGLVGSSPAIRRVIATIDKISRYKTSVLILGESGTGKELIARALHSRGPRRQQLFVPINCATLGRDLLENELFGHERGAFTGADERKKGLFELADGGTLFLDEIGEMDPSTQAKLLRVLERNEFRRVGGTGKVQVDLSVLAATNRNVEEAIRAGKFREDLYYRLKVVTLTVPPLRERKEDIPALIETFIADFNRRHDGKIRGISPQALALLMAHDWPGNVRELKNAVEAAAILAAAETIGADGFADLARRLERRGAPGVEEGARAGAGGSIAVPADATLAQAERLLIAAALRRHRSKREVARALGIGLRTLYTKLRETRLGSRSQGRAESAQ
jgi:DNA-binding NtrC family response regulator